MSELLIDVTGLSRRFGRVRAVHDLAFQASRGEILGFLGPNGAGKTTTMRMLTGYLTPTAGRAIVAGHDIIDDPYAVRAKLGYLAERNPLYLEMRVDAYLRHRAQQKGVPRRSRASRVDAVIEAVDLAPMRERIIETLSKGYRQRVGLADALVHDPEVLILDEPTVGLDPNQVRGIRAFLREWGRDRLVVLSTHILGEVEAICDRALVIRAGEKVADEPVAELSARFDGDLERAFWELTAPAESASDAEAGA
jgi:ABC-2 type transport system ATP-binding protein